MSLRQIIRRNELFFIRVWGESLSDIRQRIDVGTVAALVERGDIDRLLGSLGYVNASFSSLDDPLREAYVLAGRSVSSPGFLQGRSALSFDHRTPRSVALLNELSTALSSRLVSDGRVGVAGVLEARGLRSVQQLALDLAGRIDPVSRRREGGLVGLNSEQMGWVQSARLSLGTPGGMRSYLGLSLRDRRFDPTIESAIAEGRQLKPEYIDRVVGRYADSVLLHRGKQIAQTQVTQAANAGAYESMRQRADAGELPRFNKRWRVRSSNPRHTHQGLNGVSVPLDEPFRTSRGYELLFPGDTSYGADAREIVNCQCEVEYEIANSG